jgi:hypothetical protein
MAPPQADVNERKIANVGLVRVEPHRGIALWVQRSLYAVLRLTG